MELQKPLPPDTPVLNNVPNKNSTEFSNKQKLDSQPENIFEVEGSVEDFFDRDEEADMYSDSYSENSNESEN